MKRGSKDIWDVKEVPTKSGKINLVLVKRKKRPRSLTDKFWQSYVKVDTRNIEKGYFDVYKGSYFHRDGDRRILPGIVKELILLIKYIDANCEPGEVVGAVCMDPEKGYKSYEMLTYEENYTIQGYFQYDKDHVIHVCRKKYFPRIDIAISRHSSEGLYMGQKQIGKVVRPLYYTQEVEAMQRIHTARLARLAGTDQEFKTERMLLEQPAAPIKTRVSRVNKKNKVITENRTEAMELHQNQSIEVSECVIETKNNEVKAEVLSFEVADKLDNVFETENHAKHITFIESDANDKLKVSSYEFLKSAERLGFRTDSKNSAKLLHINELNIFTEVSAPYIKTTFLKICEALPDAVRKSHGKTVKRVDYLNTLLDSTNLFCNQMLSTLQPMEKRILRGTVDSDIVPYKNCVIRVTKKGIEELPYNGLTSPVWDKQVINRNYTYTEYKEGDAVFYKFCNLLAKNDSLRLRALMSQIGYLLHTHKDPTRPIVIIFTDEMLSEFGEANGGVGKSIVVTAISLMRTVCQLDGRTIKLQDRFANESIRPYHTVRVIEDIRKGWNFDDIVQEATGITEVGKKHKDKECIPFSESPKTLITGNYLPLGSGGNTEERRKAIFEFGSYFNKNHTPMDEFGHRFFDDWSDEEWSKFDAFMLECVRLFLSEGIIKVELLNVVAKTIIQKTNENFYWWFHTKVQEDQKVFDKAAEIDIFKAEFPDYKNISGRQFTTWIKAYLNTVGIKYQEDPIDTRKRILIN